MTTGNEGTMGKYLTPIAVILGAAVIGGAVIWSGGTRGSNPNDPNAVAQEVDINEVATDSPIVGDSGAPTTVAIYYDYQCPFCKQFELTVVPQLMENYVNTGKTKLVYKDFQFLGEDSITAALFGRALYDVHPEHFDAWSMAMANDESREGSAQAGGLAAVQAVARGIEGVDVDRVTANYEENRDKYMAAIEADYQEGSSFGINGTPSIIVGNKLLTGMAPAQFYAAIAAELDAQL